ncbi:MAG: desulfoferrodoxin [Bacteroidaceae bacterium]
MKTNAKEIYRCSTCGGVVEVLHSGAVMYCCGNPMTLLKGNVVDGAKEKHVPVVEIVENGVRVTIGAVEHPMQPDHYIEWIELVTPTQVLRQELKPGDKPQALFQVQEKHLYARAYCNLHGLWKA